MVMDLVLVVTNTRSTGEIVVIGSWGEKNSYSHQRCGLLVPYVRNILWNK